MRHTHRAQLDKELGMSQLHEVSYASVSPWMRSVAALVLFVYTSVVVSPGVHAAQEVTQGVINDARAHVRAREVAHATTLEGTVRELRTLRERGARAAQLEDDRTKLRQLHAQLVSQNREARAEFEAFEAELRSWGASDDILQRHRAAVNKLTEEAGRTEDELMQVVLSNDANSMDGRVETLLNRLSKVRTRKPHQRFDAREMPYGPANNKARAPRTNAADLATLFDQPQPPRVLLAAADASIALQVGGTLAVAPEYLSATEDVQITQDIRDLAAFLNSNPVTIYNWVRNNIQYLPTYGSIQGSQVTLQNGRGNAYDTASLLIALYRAAGIPARYAYGTVEVPIERVINWVGVSSADEAQDLIGQGGIPNVAVTAGGVIKSLRFEHVWVEAWVDFVPSRGARHVEGDSWIAVDPSFIRYIIERAIDPATTAPFDAAASLEQLTDASTVDAQSGVITALDVAGVKSTFRSYENRLAEAIDQLRPGATSLDLLDRRYIEVVEDPVLPAGLPYRMVASGRTYAALPAALRHSLTISLYASALDQSEELPQVSRSISLPAIGLRRVSVNYRRASDADAALIQSAVENNATSLPAYLIRVVPELKLDETVLSEGPAVTMGDEQFWQARLSGPIPASNADVPFNHTVAGDLLVFSVDGAGIVGTAAEIRRGGSYEPNAAEDLHFAGLSYWTAHNWTDRYTAEGLGGRIVRLPSVALLSAGFTPRYFFGIARQASYQGRVLDARRVSIAAVARSNQIRRAIVLLAGIQGSQWEATSLNSVFGRAERTAMSATEYLTYATTHGVPIQVIAPGNLNTALNNLQISPDVVDDIVAAVQAGKIAMVPQRDLNVRGRIGNGYVILDTETGAGAYLIDGGLNGGFECPCSGPSALPPVASSGGGGGGGGSALLAAAGIAPAALPALAEVASTVPNIIRTEAALVRVAEIGAQAANSPFFAQARNLAPRLTPPVTFRMVAGGFALALGAAVLTTVIFAVALSIAVLFTYHMAQIELALLAAEGGASAAVYPTPTPAPEPNPDEDDCKCQPGSQLPECQCTMEIIPHKGGHAVHNACAQQHSDVEGDICWYAPRLKIRRCYDGGSADGKRVVEVKVNRYSGYSSWLKNKTVKNNTTQAIIQQLVATECELSLSWVTKNTLHATDLNAAPAFPTTATPDETCGDAPDEDLPPEDIPGL